ncbi:MAG TPA: DUF2269 family protein [Acidimicrobiales bacterium]|jgi:hypothetical protein|nr:DUF2269 family protein [Acidimicrobiales bacterium]
MTTSAAAADRASRFGRRARNFVLTVHIVVSVGLLGDSAGFLAVAIRRATSDDPSFVDAAHDLLGTFALLFGIPLSFLALLTGTALGLGTPWGLFRYPWVVTKLALIVTVIVVGATVLSPVLADDSTADGTALIIGAAYDVAALTAATALAVFKPGRARRRATASAAAGLSRPGTDYQ